jgi:hypothetical protein
LALTLDQVNAIRARTGQEPLTELPVETVPGNQEDEAAKKKAEEEAKPKAAEGSNPSTPSIPETDEQSVLKFLRERGISVDSINDLNKPVTEADLAKEAEERESAKLTFGLNKGLFNRKTHEQFILDRNSKQDLVFAHYAAESKKEDPELTDEEIQTEFAEKYGLSSEPNTRKHKRGQEEINLLGDLILQKKYASIYKLDTEFDQHESQIKGQKEIENKIRLQAPTYKKDIEDVFSELKKISHKYGEDEQYELEASEESLNDLKAKFLDSNYVAQKILQGYTKEQLKETAFTAYLSQNWPTLVKKMAEQMAFKKEKGVRGIVPVSTQSQQAQEQVSEVNKKVMQRVFPNHQPVGAN